jgi:hypothetical protein
MNESGQKSIQDRSIYACMIHIDPFQFSMCVEFAVLCMFQQVCVEFAVLCMFQQVRRICCFV